MLALFGCEQLKVAGTRHIRAILLFSFVLLRERSLWKRVRTTQRFKPLAVPHFGGLWEAVVCSAKHHLRRVVGDTSLTFEEMTTFLTQVEACLNSRPLQVQSDDPNDLVPLKPNNFLIVSPIFTVPEPFLINLKQNRLQRWQLTRHMYEDFWTRWCSEYL
ncbi:uncharacterized protein LOC117177813 [Belonocnema kinseyi]|uniref:uncharacterized protein LOC117177813 n=1 Tax=Belonocnema kinseyi TaxID=2817044 RepID=UPI00143DBC0B|nr:uncharacterized protein LOC117177813 [Belonocnema kinseyi]